MKYSLIDYIAQALKIQPVPAGKTNPSEGILPWGINNDMPKKIIDTINGSVTGSACINTVKKYIYGRGVSTQADVNKTQTINALHADLSSQLSKLRGVSVHVSYRPDGSIGAIKKIPFESVRLGIPDDNGNISIVKYNPYYGTADFNQKYTKAYPLYSPTPEELFKKVESFGGWINFPGEVLYKSVTSEFNPFYPLPEWWGDNMGNGGGRKWMEIDQLIGNFHSHNINKGFLQNVLLKMIGDPDEPLLAEDQIRKSNGEKYTSVGDDFSKTLTESFSGAKGDKMLILWSAVKDQFPELQAFPTNTNHELFLALQKLTTENILISTQVPPVLAGVKVSGTLSKDDIENSVKLMWGNVEMDQQLLEDIYNTLLPRMGVTGEIKIMNFSPVVLSVDPLAWATLTLDEQRLWVQQNTELI